MVTTASLVSHVVKVVHDPWTAKRYAKASAQPITS
jgi:hypothetical protein